LKQNVLPDLIFLLLWDILKYFIIINIHYELLSKKIDKMYF
jgi:hypothetical protein